jgi:hypothetical protein
MVGAPRPSSRQGDGVCRRSLHWARRAPWSPPRAEARGGWFRRSRAPTGSRARRSVEHAHAHADEAVGSVNAHGAPGVRSRSSTPARAHGGLPPVEKPIFGPMTRAAALLLTGLFALYRAASLTLGQQDIDYQKVMTEGDHVRFVWVVAELGDPGLTTVLLMPFSFMLLLWRPHYQVRPDRAIVRYRLGGWLPWTQRTEGAVPLAWDRYFANRGEERVPVGYMLRGRVKKKSFDIEYVDLDCPEDERERIRAEWDARIAGRR